MTREHRQLIWHRVAAWSMSPASEQRTTTDILSQASIRQGSGLLQRPRGVIPTTSIVMNYIYHSLARLISDLLKLAHCSLFPPLAEEANPIYSCFLAIALHIGNEDDE